MADAAKDQALPIGAMIEEFRVVKILGTGSFGVVYQCDNTHLEQTAAIKEFLPTELAARQPNGLIAPLAPVTEDAFRWALERFLQEAKTLWGLGRPARHPNIAQVTRYRELNGSAYMFMEFEHGRPFAAVLEERSTLPYPELEALIAPLLSGLQRVHEGGILHRDIKPANILIRADGSPVLIDFGSAKIVTSNSERSVFATYTPRYAALEQHQDVAEQGPWTDIYGLGATLYRAVTGTPPKSASQRLLSDPQQPATELARGGYPEHFLRAIDHACALEPQKRPQSIPEWRLALLGTQSDQGYAPTVFRPASRARTLISRPTSLSTEPPDAAQGRSTPRPEPAPDPLAPQKRRRLTHRLPVQLALTLLALAGIAVWLLTRTSGPDLNEEQDLPFKLPVASQNRPASAVNYEALALDHFRRAEFDPSLRLVEMGLKGSPHDPRLLALQSHVEAYQQAEGLLRDASQAFRAGELSRSLQLIADGLDRIANHPGLDGLKTKVLEQQAENERSKVRTLAEQAHQALASGDLDQASAMVEQGRLLSDNNASLLALRKEIETTRAQQAAVASTTRRFRLLFEDGQLEEAAKALSDALALDPKNSELLRLRERLDSALTEQQRARIADILARANAALQRGNIDESVSIVDAGLADTPSEPELQRLRAELVARRNQERVTALLDKAKALLDQGDLSASLEAIDRGLELAPDSAELADLRSSVSADLQRQETIRQAVRDVNALQKTGELSASLERLKSALLIAPGDSELLSLESEIRERQMANRMAEAATLATKARQAYSSGALEEANTLVTQGLSLVNNDETLLALKKEIESAHEQQAALNAKATEIESQLEQGVLEAAEEALSEALALNPENSRFLDLRERLDTRLADERQARVADVIARARSALDHRQPDEAQRIAEQGLSLVPGHPALSDLLEEVKASRAEVMRDREEVARLLTLAGNKSAEGAYDEALAAVEKARRIDPKNPDGAQLRERIEQDNSRHQRQHQQKQELLQQARQQFQAGELEASLGSVQQGLELAPNNSDLLGLLDAVSNEIKIRTQVAHLRTQLERQLEQELFDEGLHTLEEALELIPTDHELLSLRRELRARIQEREAERRVAELLELAQEKEQEGDIGESLRLLRNASALIPGDPKILSEEKRVSEISEDEGTIAALLKECEGHFRAKRLTTGSGTAFDCYRKVLELDPENALALKGIEKIADQYAEWAAAMIDQSNAQKARRYVEKLANVDPKHAQLSTLRGRLEDMESSIARAREEAKKREATKRRPANIAQPERQTLQSRPPPMPAPPPAPPVAEKKQQEKSEPSEPAPKKPRRSFATF